MVKVEAPDGDPWRSWSVGGGPSRSPTKVARCSASSTTAPVGRRQPRRPGDRRAARRRPTSWSTASTPSRVRRAGVARDRTRVWSSARSRRTAAPGPYADRPMTEFIVQAESGGLVGRGSARPGADPGRWPHQRVGVGHVRRGRGHRRCAPLRSDTGHGEHIDFSGSEAMTIAGGSYGRVRAYRCAGARRSRPCTRTFETPSVEPTLDGYVGFCTNSRDQFDDFLPAHRAARPRRRRAARERSSERQKRWKEWNDIVHEWTTQHTTAEIVQLRERAAHPGCAGAQRREHPRLRALRRARRVRRRPDRHVQDAAPAVAHRRRRPAAAASRRPARRAHRRDRGRACRAAPAPIGDPPLPLAGVRVLDLTAWWAGPIAAGHDRRARRRRHPRRVDRPHRRHAHDRRQCGLDGPWWERSVALPVREHEQARPHARSRAPTDGPGAAAVVDRRERRDHRELLAARDGELRARRGTRSRRSTRAACSCACPRSACRARGATTADSRRPWSRSPGSRGSPVTSRPAAHPARPERPERGHARGVRDAGRVSPSATPPDAAASSR